MAWDGKYSAVLSDLSKRLSAVHKAPANRYHQFVNAFVFVSPSLSPEEGVQKAQRQWKTASQNDDLCAAIFERASKRIDQLKRNDITSFFKVQPEVANENQERLETSDRTVFFIRTVHY